MIINKKIVRTMLESKSQYVGSLVLIIISCLLYTMFNQLASNLTNISSSFEKNYVQEDASFIIDTKLVNIPKLESKFNMKLEETGSFDYSVSNGKLKNDKTLRIFTENIKVNLPAITEGRDLTTGDVLIDPGYAKTNKIRLNDSIKIYNRPFKVSGFMSLPNYIYPLKSESDLLNDSTSFGLVVMSWKDYNKINMGSSLYSIKFQGSKNSVDSRVSELKDYLKSQNIVVLKWMNINENPRVTYVSAKIDGITQMSSSMPVAILLLTCILTGIVMWRMLKKEAVIIGTLYALGYRKREIMRHYLRYPLFIAFTGGIIGTLLGAFTLKPMIDLMVTYFNMPIGHLNFSIKYVTISILLPVIFLIICSYFVVNQALKYSPLDLMKGGKEKGKVGFIERKLKLENLKFKTKFKVREQLRNIPRSIFLLLGVVMATMLLLLGFAEKSSMDFLVKNTYGDSYTYQYQYMFNSVKQGKPQKGEAFTISPFTLKSDIKTSFAVYGVNPDDKYILLKDKSGNKLSFDKVIITKPLADKLKIKAQDTILVINKLDSKEYNITVDSIAETYVGDYIYMPIVKLNNMLKFPSHSYIGVWSEDKIKIPENELLSTTSIDDFKKAFDSMTQPMQYAVGTMSVMSFIIGLIVIYVVTSLVIEENKENISLMKVFGYRKKEVYSLILNSSSFIIVIGYIIGVPLLLLSLGAMFKSVTKSMNFSFPVTIDYSYVIIGFFVIYLNYEISKNLSKKKVNKISMNEVLKSMLE